MSIKRTSEVPDSAVPDSAKQRALDAAAQVVPMAKTAGLAAKSSAEDAVAWATPHVNDARAWATPHVNDARAWATPHVNDARAWAAPQLEQAGIAVRDKLAPTISAALVEAARRLDVPARRRRWPWVLGGAALLAAVGSAIAAVVLRRRSEVVNFGAEGYPAQDGAMPTAGEANGTQASDRVQENGSGDEAEANARVRKS